MPDRPTADQLAGCGARLLEASICFDPSEQSPRLDLEPGTKFATEVWMVVGQRGLSMVCEDLHQALDEIDDLDDKYRPAYLAKGRIDHVEVLAVRDFSDDEN